MSKEECQERRGQGFFWFLIRQRKNQHNLLFYIEIFEINLDMFTNSKRIGEKGMLKNWEKKSSEWYGMTL
jgi:hypothetical protein